MKLYVLDLGKIVMMGDSPVTKDEGENPLSPSMRSCWILRQAMCCSIPAATRRPWRAHDLRSCAAIPMFPANTAACRNGWQSWESGRRRSQP